MKNGKSKLSIKEKEKAFNKMNKSAMKDLKSYANKWHNYNHKPDVIFNEDHLQQWPFFLQMRDACHNALVTGACVHSLNAMIKDAKKEAVEFHKDLLKEGK